MTRIRLFGAAALLFAVFAVLAVFVAVGGHAVPGPDQWVADAMYGLSSGHDSVAATARLVGRVTEPTVLRVLALGGAVVLLIRGHSRAALWLLATMSLGAVLGIGAKLVYTRPRPLWDIPITAITGYSFPSGHAVNSMVFAGCLLVVLGASGWRWLVAAGFVLAVGLDRMLLGVHYLSDVVGGWTFGAAIVLVMLGAWPPGPPLRPPPDETAGKRIRLPGGSGVA